MSGYHLEVPAFDADSVLRYVEIDSQVSGVAPYRMLLWDTGSTYEPWRARIGIAFYKDDYTQPFMLSYCGPGMGQAIDSDEICASALGCVTMRPGDTDEEWFADYTPAQMEWAESWHCEALQIIPFDVEQSEYILTYEESCEWRETENGRRFVNKETGEQVFKDLGV